jgi:hypothetical protein
MEIRAFVQMGTEALCANRTSRARRAKTLRDHLVIYYHKVLEDSLGKEQRFKVAYDELSSNASIGKRI